jgi:hypothetical protein
LDGCEEGCAEEERAAFRRELEESYLALLDVSTVLEV